MSEKSPKKAFASVWVALVVIGSSAFFAAAVGGTSRSLAPAVPASPSAETTSSALVANAAASLRSGAGPAAGGRGWTCNAASGATAATCSVAPGASPASSLPYEWQSPVGPQARAAGTMTYDPVDHEIVLFGGVDSSQDPLNDTWIYNASGWQELFLSRAPPPQYLASMAFDATDRYVLLFGGLGGAGTWSFVHDTWTRLLPHTAPSPRFGGAMTYDAKDGYILYFGGYPNGAGASDTWKFVGGQWTNITRPVAPPGRGEAQMVYDPADGYVLLYGGATYPAVEIQGGNLNDTWTYAAGVWTQLHPKTEPGYNVGGDFMGAITYDAKDGYVLLFGGQYGSEVFTWKFLHGQWSEINSHTNPPGQYLAMMAYDPDTSSALLIDGCYAENLYGNVGCPVGVVGLTNPDGALLGQWTFAGGQWTTSSLPTQPGYSYSASMTYDPREGYVLFYAGPGQTWEFGGGRWTQLDLTTSPPVNGYMAMTYDAKDGYVLLFGGNDVQYQQPFVLGSFFSNQTWKFEYGRWTELDPSTVPAGRAGAAMAYDAADGYVLMFGGGIMTNSGSTPVYDGTWAFAGGQWTELSPTTHPKARSTAAMVYDAADGYIVLFGGCSQTSCSTNGGSFYGDTWTFRHGEWSAVHSTISPPARAEAGMAYDGPGAQHGLASGGVILFGGTSFPFGGNALGDTWFFLHGQWHAVSVEYAPPTRFGAAFAYDGANGRILMQGGQSGLTDDNDGTNSLELNDTWEFVISS